MSKPKRPLWPLVRAAVYLNVIVVCVFTIDWSINNTSDRLSEARLTVVAHEDLDKLRVNVDQLEQRRKAMAETARLSVKATEPTPSEIRELAASYQLSVYRIERLDTRKPAREDVRPYTVILNGGVMGLVRFLQVVEDEYRFYPELVTLKAADHSGEVVALTLVMPMRAI